MKIKRTIIVTLLFALLILSGCGYSNELPVTQNTTQDENNDVISGTHFKKIDGRDDLVYDVETNNIFYMISKVGTTALGYGYLSPYIGQKGHPCKYIGGEIVEYEYLNGEFIYYSA